jgi:hypothetical protein
MAAVDSATTIVREVLSKYLRSEKRITDATNDVVAGISHLLTIQPVSKRKKGATVMTESAAVRLPDGTFRSKPQNL